MIRVAVRMNDKSYREYKIFSDETYDEIIRLVRREVPEARSVVVIVPDLEPELMVA